jgi:hypothetical protein
MKPSPDLFALWLTLAVVALLALAFAAGWRMGAP